MIKTPVANPIEPCAGLRATACRDCPSTKRIDPEVQDILTWPREKQLETVFTCAWTAGRLCRGYVDLLRLTDAEIEAAIQDRKESNA